MKTSRLEAFSDGVIAILITIMVLELKTPEGSDWTAVRHELPNLCAYVLSFVFLGIYWNNHHHMLSLTERIDGTILWANLHLLFWLSLVPFGTAWMGRTHVAPLPTALYGVVLLCCGAAYTILQTAIIARQGKDSPLRDAVGRDAKGKMSVLLYAIAVAIAFVKPWIAAAIYGGVASIWLIPDPRIEKRVHERG